jgi:hypothetical protein
MSEPVAGLPGRPADREKKLKSLIAGERGHGFAEIMPEPRTIFWKDASLAKSVSDLALSPLLCYEYANRSSCNPCCRP